MSELKRLAPADRPPGQRGWRAELAGLLLFAIVPCVGAITAYETGGWGSGSTSVDYRVDGPGWAHHALVAAAIALGVSGLLLWVARSPALLVVGLALGGLAIAGAVWTVVERSRPGRVDVAEMRALPIGTSRAEVRHRFGPPAGHATLSRPGIRKSCDLYRSRLEDRYGDHRQFALCFSHGRLTDRVGS